MQDDRVLAAADDGLEARRLGTFLHEHILDDRLHLVLVHARRDRTGRLTMRIHGDVDGAPEQPQLLVLLVHPELRENGAERTAVGVGLIDMRLAPRLPCVEIDGVSKLPKDLSAEAVAMLEALSLALRGALPAVEVAIRSRAQHKHHLLIEVFLDLSFGGTCHVIERIKLLRKRTSPLDAGW